jgi:tetratricopeptide (TPR) repeat protein
MVERHYDDESLISLMEMNRAGSDTHLPSCEQCSGKLQSVRMLAGTLRDRTVWETRPLSEEPNRNTIATLRAFANRMADEDTRAETYLRDLLEGPRETWMAKLNVHPEYRTAGVVRKLIAAASRAVDTMPPDAVEMTGLAVEIADQLDPATLPSDAASRLSGQAWRERAFALFYVGTFSDALVAADRADACFADCTVDEYDRARTDIVRALTLRAKEEVSTAMVAARRSAETFLRFEDGDRMISARLAEVHLLATHADYGRAVEILESIEPIARMGSNIDTQARIYGNLGYCYWKLGRIDDALPYHDMAAALFDELGIRTEAARTRWNVAGLLATAGRTDEALTRFAVLKTEFERFGMSSEAAILCLDVAELHLARGESFMVQELCRDAMRSFEMSGTAYTARALTALAYLQETARLGKATTAITKHVRQYLRQLPQDQTLLFVPLPA